MTFQRYFVYSCCIKFFSRRFYNLITVLLLFLYYRPLHLAIIHALPTVEAIISIAPSKECLDIFNYLRQVNTIPMIEQYRKLFLSTRFLSMRKLECLNRPVGNFPIFISVSICFTFTFSMTVPFFVNRHPFILL
jgi:hypothetical protein